MIVWPHEGSVGRAGREGLRRFRESSASAEVDAAPGTWRVVAWPWTEEPPLRVMLENEAHDEVVFAIDADGLWMLSRVASVSHSGPPAILGA